MEKQVFNPFTPLDDYIPDGEPHVFGDRVYVYGSHDKENGEFFCMLDYVTYSAPIDNLKDWRYEGVIYKASQDPLYPKYKYMYAPDVVQGNDGRFYLFYSIADNKNGCSNILSVAVCDTPHGEFQFHGFVRNPDGTPMQKFGIFDPGVINDDGVIRLYYGVWHNWYEDPKFTVEDCIFHQMRILGKTREQVLQEQNEEGGCFGPVTVELEDDMLTIKHTPVHILPNLVKGTEWEDHPFFEASSIRKVGSKYYFIYSSYKGHELIYATSDYPDRDFKFGGAIISNGDVGLNGRLPENRVTRTGNNHGSIEFINGEWYVFYHRQTTKWEYSRQACAEKIKILPDGTIPQVEVTSCGLNNGPLIAEGVYPAIISCNLTNYNMPHGKCPERRLPHIICKKGERIIAEIDNNTHIGFKYFRFNGPTKVGVNYRAGELPPSGEILIKLEEYGEPVARISLSAPEAWEKAFTILDIQAGTVSPIFFVYKGEGEIELKEIEFSNLDD